MENIKRIVLNIAVMLLVILCVLLVIIGQKSIGYTGLSLMLIGLLGLVGMLYLYNRRYK